MSKLYHHKLLEESIWHQEVPEGFNDLIVSWNGLRPKRGTFSFYIRVKQSEWSSWHPLAVWGTAEDGSCLQGSCPQLQDPIAKLDVDTLAIRQGTATAFEVKVEVPESSDLTLFASTSLLPKKNPSSQCLQDSFVIPQVPFFSQHLVKHPRASSLCSPSSTWSVIRFISPELHNNGFLNFASAVHDQYRDIYGNWILNTAAAYEKLKGDVYCIPLRLNGFEELTQYVRKGIPLVVSIKGPMEGSPHPYAEGHLMVVKGWNSEKQQVICMDPAFSYPNEPHVCYPFASFMQAWERRSYLAYVFQAKSEIC